MPELFVSLQATKLVKNENVMLQTLGFDIAIEHPHTFVVKCCQMVRGECEARVMAITNRGTNSEQRLGSDLLLHGDEQLAPDDDVPAVQADSRRLRLHPFGLQMV